MHQVIELVGLSSSLCRCPSSVSRQSEHPRALYNATRIEPGLRWSLSKDSASVIGRRRRHVLNNISLRCSSVSMSTGQSETGTKFGASTLRDYEVSEPRKVNQSSVDTSTGADVLDRLKRGFVKFKEDRFLKESDLFSQLAEGQQPKVMVIACADSRVCPTMLMGLDPGEVFTVRNVANLVPPCEKDKGFHGTSAALEFAVLGLGVEHIIVIGHRNCGGIKALMTRKTDEIESDFIGSWISTAIPAKNHTLERMSGKSFADQCKYCEQEAINGSLANLLTFPWIKERFESGALGLHGWYYDFVVGDLMSWEVLQPTADKPLERAVVSA